MTIRRRKASNAVTSLTPQHGASERDGLDGGHAPAGIARQVSLAGLLDAWASSPRGSSTYLAAAGPAAATGCNRFRELPGDQQLRRDLKLVAARDHVRKPCERRLRVALVGLDHQLDAETKQRTRAGIEVQTRSYEAIGLPSC